jgi:hypothetical protein
MLQSVLRISSGGNPVRTSRLVLFRINCCSRSNPGGNARLSGVIL